MSGGGLGVVFFEFNTDGGIKCVEVVVAPLAACPINLCEWTSAVICSKEGVNFFVQFDDFGFGLFVIFVGMVALDITGGNPIGALGFWDIVEFLGMFAA